jgi:hypothetical protein
LLGHVSVSSSRVSGRPLSAVVVARQDADQVLWNSIDCGDRRWGARRRMPIGRPLDLQGLAG